MAAHIADPRRFIIEQAARWYVCCMDEGMTLQQFEEMKQWLAASPEHEMEFAQMFAMDELLVAAGMGRRRYQ